MYLLKDGNLNILAQENTNIIKRYISAFMSVYRKENTQTKVSLALVIYK